jgi:hypothetical protein
MFTLVSTLPFAGRSEFTFNTPFAVAVNVYQDPPVAGVGDVFAPPHKSVGTSEPYEATDVLLVKLTGVAVAQVPCPNAKVAQSEAAIAKVIFFIVLILICAKYNYFI